jgi:formylglycine-generating enzyme required for sulfatase activity
MHPSAVEGKNPSKFTGDSSLPVEKVSWDDCQAFLQRLNGRVSGLHARLPTEAEWEYACRAGTTGTHAGDMEAMGWFEDNANLQSHPVAQKKANAWGLYDMHGNVAEWCSDWYGDYSIDAITDPTGPATGKLRIHRGGAWVFVDFFCRSGQRDKTSQDSSYDSLGLRFVVPG